MFIITWSFETVADLSDLAAQTDAFARAQRPVTGRDGPSTTASSPTTALQTNRLSSYSSVVSSAARTVSLDQLPATTSGSAKPSVTSSGVDVGQRSAGAGLATGMWIRYASAAYVNRLEQARETSDHQAACLSETQRCIFQ